MNVKRKCVELRTSQYTVDRNAVQKCVEFLKAFFLGFDLNDAIALLRLDDLFLDTFMIKDGTIYCLLSLLTFSNSEVDPKRRPFVQSCG